MQFQELIGYLNDHGVRYQIEDVHTAGPMRRVLVGINLQGEVVWMPKLKGLLEFEVGVFICPCKQNDPATYDTLKKLVPESNWSCLYGPTSCKEVMVKWEKIYAAAFKNEAKV